MKAQPDVIVYTDGACQGNPGPGGWAVILKHPATGKVKKLSGGEANTTNNRMELRAAIEGLKALRGDKRRRVHLVSDSEYLINGVTTWIDGWIANEWRRGKKLTSPPVKNVDLWQELHALREQHDLTFEHVRGHSGHPENEECDRMAVAAIKALPRGGTAKAGGASTPSSRPVRVSGEAQSTRVPKELPTVRAPQELEPAPAPQGLHSAVPAVRRAFTGAKWEKEIGYCRAIRSGNHIYVTGTAPIDQHGKVFAPGDAYAQAKRCLEIIRRALTDLGATTAQVVRTRMFVSDIGRWREFGKAHREFFADHPPATTMVEVRSLIDPQMLIEIEADAVAASDE